MMKRGEVTQTQNVVRDATYVVEELERTLGLVKNGYFPECKTGGLLIDLLEIIANNARTSEENIKTLTGTDYPWEQETDNGGIMSIDKISTKWAFTLIGRGDQ